MNRRAFSGRVLAGTGLAAALNGQGQSGPRPISSAKTSMQVIDLQTMRAQYRKDLFDDYLPFHERFVNDKQYGGFHCSVRPTGELVSDEKRVWYEGRGTWVYSFLYNNIAREQKYLDVAAGSVRLLEKSKPAGDEFRPKSLKRDGSPVGPPDTEVYSDMFVAEGLAEFSRTGERSTGMRLAT